MAKNKINSGGLKILFYFLSTRIYIVHCKNFETYEAFKLKDERLRLYESDVYDNHH